MESTPLLAFLPPFVESFVLQEEFPGGVKDDLCYFLGGIVGGRVLTGVILRHILLKAGGCCSQGK